jgi:hypothetical protein
MPASERKYTPMRADPEIDRGIEEYSKKPAKFREARQIKHNLRRIVRERIRKLLAKGWLFISA